MCFFVQSAFFHDNSRINGPKLDFSLLGARSTLWLPAGQLSAILANRKWEKYGLPLGPSCNLVLISHIWWTCPRIWSQLCVQTQQSCTTENWKVWSWSHVNSESNSERAPTLFCYFLSLGPGSSLYWKNLLNDLDETGQVDSANPKYWQLQVWSCSQVDQSSNDQRAPTLF